MSTAAHLLRINAVELLRQPGSTRAVEAVVQGDELDIDDERLSGPVQVSAGATSTIDGVSVRGVVRTPWHSECRRCLVEVDGLTESPLDELFQHNPSDSDTLEIVGDQIDLVPVVREYVLLDLPDGPLCRPDCAGICPICGADRNIEPCSCDSGPTDIRWTALEGLSLPEPPEG